MRAIGCCIMAAGLVSGCTSVQVNRVDAGQHPAMKTVCIEKNPKVIVKNFVPIVQDGFRRHGIATAVYDPPLPQDCQYWLTYTAKRGWDFAPFLNYAELTLRDGNAAIGSATYRHAGGFGLNKWASTESKMNPVIDQLLAGY